MDALIMSHLHDSGQNIRFKQAADRHGGSLTALILHPGQDLAGIGARYKTAADRHMPKLRIRSVHRSNTYIRYPSDIRLAGNGGVVRRLWDGADVVHINNHPRPYFDFDNGQRKPILMHHHGTMFRENHREYLGLAQKHRWAQAVSTVDLMRYAPDVLTWLPAAYNLNELAGLREKHRRPDDGKVRIAHAPTDREIKSTEALIAAVATLQAEGLPVELELIEKVTWAECLARKAPADIYFDQVKLGYGCNAIEAWGMGMPVMAGADSWTLGAMIAQFGGPLPFFETSEDTITDRLREMVKSADLRAEWAAKGMEHAIRFHAEIPALERLVDLYLKAIDQRAAVKSRAVA